ncbi:TrkH family potassium uptake protein [Oscillibacter sp. MSJ-2]|uniref:TrkH family potassium uptake protein n=1 Tax=Dysosmobacter acutus TaxID=2841504 RepID=A0ABS6F5E6_9FIRM|nr:TrkH family potassium uptake protein [Dysosmobacter acutus]
MNYRMVGFILGRILLVESVLMLLPLMVTLAYGESAVFAFCLPIVLSALCGALLGVRTPKNTTIYAKEGLVIVALSWLAMSLFGALPFYLCGSFSSFVDCFFETVSGFTTTGASILTEVESLEHGILFWRSFTHWVGGMGVLVFVMAILPLAGGRSVHLLRAEVPGPSVGKLVSRLGNTAKILYGIYIVLTLIEVVFLLAGGMSLFDALIHSFGSAGTGGFSNRNLSVGAYNNAYYDVVISTFMLLFGVNFNLYYFLLLRRFREVFRSEELKVYLGIVFASVMMIAVNLLRYYDTFLQCLRYAFFQVSSIITTTGYATADFEQWPSFSKTILVILMFIGASAGSTGGGIKVARIVILCKSSYRDLQRMLHPHAVTTVRFEGKPLDDKTLRGTYMFFSIYMGIFALSILLLSLEHFDLITTFTAVTACINNIGPGLSIVGPMGNYSGFSALGKLLLSFNMLVGRLEIFPVLMLLAPSVWKKPRRFSSSKKPCPYETEEDA